MAVDKNCHSVRQVVISCEKLSANDDAAKGFVKIFVSEKQFVADQVFNIDEPGLNCKMLPQKNSCFD